MKKIIGIFIILLAVQLVFAGVVSAKELKTLAKSGDVIIVSARNASDYSSKHIADAINIDHKSLYKEEGVSSMLKSVDDIAKIFGDKGISTDSKIVIYDTGSNKAAGRLYWIFKYMGAADVNILDGHLKGWGKIRGKVTKNATKITPTTFKAIINAAILTDMAYVKAHKDDSNVVLLDVRSADEFAGTDTDKNIKRYGHIPGAVNLEFKAVVNENGTIKSKEEIASAINDAGITSDKEVILYCASSVRAGVVYMALKDILGYKNVKVYDGAYYEWQSDAANPIK
ncbi:MAG: sulfurtransferase [Candidatus Cloacimonadota bacterium]|nr:sulfurtransferase [Candidatus Cloacimonadota bacterium]